MFDNKLTRKLPRYYRYLKEQLEYYETEFVSSEILAKLMGVSPSQIRQDFSRLGYSGFHGKGYDIREILKKVTNLLETDVKKNCILVGAGNLGQSMCKYEAIGESGFILKALFDVNPKIIGLVINGYEVLDVDHLEGYIKDNDIKAAFLCTPKNVDAALIKTLYGHGVKAFLVFSPIILEEIFKDGIPGDLIIENVHIDDNIKLLSYKIKLNGQYDSINNKNVINITL
ncbi:MAG: redox-sensing transcriptional repressor Rex [Ruminiclostridium sp.]|nr:redox-sensing transcriptional repressor Rex [Ruminiclostridium sp.]